VKTSAGVFTLKRLTHREVGLRRREEAHFSAPPGWRPRIITVRDAWGNQITSRPKAVRGGGIRFSGLCRYEDAWEIEVQFITPRATGPDSRLTARFRVRPLTH